MTAYDADKTLLVIIPAFNEERAVAHVVAELREILPGVPVLVIDDSSSDATALVAGQAGAEVLRLPHHLGLGGCVQAGYKLAYELGYRHVIRIDGDGQHDPRYIPEFMRILSTKDVQMVIGSRYLARDGGYTSAPRAFGIRLFRLVLRPILGKWVLDPTSGYVGVNREALAVFSHSFPLEYPEIEALVVLQRKAFRFEEIPCEARPRKAGQSSITTFKSIYYVIHVLLGVFVNILKYEGRRRAPWNRRSAGEDEA